MLPAMPLHAITSVYGEAGLGQRLLIEIADLPRADRRRVDLACSFMSLMHAADRALQTHGGMGYSEEYHVARYFREARLMKIAPVSQEMILNFLGSHVLGLPRSY